MKFGIDWVGKKSLGAEEIAKGLEEGGDEETLQLLRLVALMNKILSELGVLVLWTRTARFFSTTKERYDQNLKISLAVGGWKEKEVQKRIGVMNLMLFWAKDGPSDNDYGLA